jgi:putative transcriptional regulator
MSKRAFDKIAEGVKEAIQIARGERQPAKLYVPPEIDVRAIRNKLGVSQDGFAASFGFTVHQIRQWEQGRSRRSRPLGAVRAYLSIIDRDPKFVLGLLRKAAVSRKVA